ncbi:MAG TPA: hypothetical protein PLI77_08450 [Bacteroidales bacterium]|nr:hypothetical protein [Bacteroidales bacterium]
MYHFSDLFFFNSDTGFAVTSNGEILKTNNGGELWTSITSGFSQHLNRITFTTPENGYISASGVI